VVSIQEQKPIILIVEDDETNGEVLALVILSETSCQPFVVLNGEDAIKAAQEMLPVLLLIDYHLPDMDGVQVYKGIRTIPGLEMVPAIFLSATVNLEELKVQYFTAIEKPYVLTAIEKPYELDELLTLIEALLVLTGTSNGPPILFL
jgi:DNA-binding response OmpR family regulator